MCVCVCVCVFVLLKNLKLQGYGAIRRTNYKSVNK